MKMRVLSLGAGVQSSTLALMAASGEVEPPDCAIFADTQAEPAHVYEWLDRLQPILERVYPVYRVSGGNLAKNIEESIVGRRFCAPPFYTESASGREGRLRRQCTQDFKINPIQRKLRELLGYKPRARVPEGLVEIWLGISTDEAHRMKPARERWVIRRWPLIEKGMARWDCMHWLERRGYRVPGKSACVFCPYHNDTTWRQIKLSSGPEWHEAVRIDRLIRQGARGGVTQRLYLHRSLKPIEAIDFASFEDLGQQRLEFGEECEGLCGT